MSLALYTKPAVPPAEYINAIEATQAPFPAWSKTKLAVRRDIFLKAAELFAASKDELVKY